MSARSQQVQKIVEELADVLRSHDCDTITGVQALSLCILAGTAMGTASEAEFLATLERVAEGLVRPAQEPDFWAYTVRTFKQPTAH
jgi:hypothetical protein